MTAPSTPQVKFKPYTRQTIALARQWQWMPPDLQEAVQVVSHVLPFRTNEYVMEQLIDWNNIPDDPIYRLTFPHRDMLPASEYAQLRDLVLDQADSAVIAKFVQGIRMRMNPHPAGQMTHNVPRVNDAPLKGLQHKYRRCYNASIMKAYSYSRYSSDAQKYGTSIDRQQTLARKWCKDNGIELSDTVYADEAVSGFHGANAATGALGAFIADREAGDIEAGSYLILENLDRLTRIDPWDAVALIQRLLTLEITVVTVRPEMVFRPEKREGIQLLQAVLFLDNAHKESARKSDLGKIEWEKRFKRARESKHHIGKRVSNWLDLADDGKYYENENAYSVREIFKLCLEGHGSTVIAQTLNAASTPTFNKGKRWGTTAVIDILKNRAAIGELVLKDGGESVPDYFPAVVDRDTFDAAQRINTARKTGKITKQSANFNVWQKLVFCGACGSNMHIIKRSTYRYLMCANRRYGQCEGSKNVRLDESEDVFKEMLLHLDALSLVMPDPEKISRELAVAEGRLHAEQSKLVIWVEKLSAHPESDSYHRLVLESEGRIRELKAGVQQLVEQLSSGEKLDWAELRAKIDLTDVATRRRANTFFHRLGVQVRIAEGYMLVQHNEARAMFAVAKGKIGFLAVDGDGEIPGAMAADMLALNVKKLVVKPTGGFVARGVVTLPNGRGTRRKRENALADVASSSGG